MRISRDECFKIVCQFSTPVSTGQNTVGTGIFIEKDGEPYILTASHVAKTVNNNTTLIFGNVDNTGIQMPLSILDPILNFKYHTVADMSVLKLNIPTDLRKEFSDRFFPYSQIEMDSNNNPSRDRELTVVGFPIGLGVQGKFSPLTFRSYPSSSYLTLDRADTNTPSDFFCLENPGCGGYSGGPVLDLGYLVLGGVSTTYGDTILKGIVHGTMSDKTGGKIALITPSYYLKDLI